MPTRLANQQTREQILALVRSGVADAAIVELFNCSLGYVEQLRRAAGINNTALVNADRYRAIYLILNTDLPWTDIAKQIGCSGQQIGKMATGLREAGFTVTRRKAGYRPE